MDINEIYEEAAEERKEFAIECINMYMEMDDEHQESVVEHLHNLYSMYDENLNSVVKAAEAMIPLIDLADSLKTDIEGV